jgi:hypothetical protein
MWFKKALSIRLIEFEAWSQAIHIQEVWKTIEQCVIHFGYRKIHFVSHMSDSFRGIGLGKIFTTDISEYPRIRNVKEAYRSTNNVNCIRQMLMHNNRSTGLDYMEEILSYLALQGLYNIDLANAFNLLSATD